MTAIRPLGNDEQIHVEVMLRGGERPVDIAFQFRVPTEWIHKVEKRMNARAARMRARKSQRDRVRAQQEAARKSAKRMEIESPPEADPTMAELLSLDRIRISKAKARS